MASQCSSHTLTTSVAEGRYVSQQLLEQPASSFAASALVPFDPTRFTPPEEFATANLKILQPPQWLMQPPVKAINLAADYIHLVSNTSPTISIAETDSFQIRKTYPMVLVAGATREELLELCGLESQTVQTRLGDVITRTCFEHSCSLFCVISTAGLVVGSLLLYAPCPGALHPLIITDILPYRDALKLATWAASKGSLRPDWPQALTASKTKMLADKGDRSRKDDWSI